jgi:hypothetical protein
MPALFQPKGKESAGQLRAIERRSGCECCRDVNTAPVMAIQG